MATYKAKADMVSGTSAATPGRAAAGSYDSAGRWTPPSSMRLILLRTRRMIQTAARTRCRTGDIEINPRVMEQLARGEVSMKDVLATLLHEIAHLHVGPRVNHGPVFKARCLALGGNLRYPGALESRAEVYARMDRRRARRAEEEDRINRTVPEGSRWVPKWAVGLADRERVAAVRMEVYSVGWGGMVYVRRLDGSYRIAGKNLLNHYVREDV